MKIVVTIKDRATETFGPLMTFHTRGEAIRSLRDALMDKQTAMARHPTDYEMWQLAEYDDIQGSIQSSIEMIARAEDHTQE